MRESTLKRKIMKYVLGIMLMLGVILTLTRVSVYAEDADNCLTFTAQEADSTVQFNWYNESASVSYSQDGGNSWETYTANETITLTNVGDTVKFKGRNVETDSEKHFSITGNVAASGDVTSLTNESGGDATLDMSCYHCMFEGCSSLTSAPALPAKTLAESCYEDMFNGCTGLTSAPALPATTLANYCYEDMFYGCTGLTSAPTLPATTLAKECYNSMFYGCTSLTSAPTLPATTMADDCYKDMFMNCTGLNISETKDASHSIEWSIPESADLANSGSGSMFSSCGDNVCFSRASDPVTLTAGEVYYQPGHNDPTPATPSTSTSTSASPSEDSIDRNPSELPSGSVISKGTASCGLKVHSVDAVTVANQTFLVNTFAAKTASNADIIATKNLDAYRALTLAENGSKQTVTWANIDTKYAGPVYAVVYNPTDKAYMVSGKIDSTGTAELNNYILRPSSTVTMFKLK